jgi:hypothetical protein
MLVGRVHSARLIVSFVFAIGCSREQAVLPVDPGQLSIGEDEVPLRLHLSYANPATTVGYGAFVFWARPKDDEIRVSAIIDAPSRTARWTECRTAVLENARGAIPIDVVYMGRPMEAGTYDAVRADLRIDQLRHLARGGTIRGNVCGDPIVLGDPHRRAIARFVDWFDRLEAPVQNGDAPAFREVGPELILLPNEEWDPGPYPS